MKFLSLGHPVKVLVNFRRGTSSLCGMAVLLGGCPARQRQPQVTRVVYVPAPAAAQAPPARRPAGQLVIEEPELPNPPDVQAPEPETPKPKPPQRHRRGNPPGTVEPPGPGVPADAVEVGPDADEPLPSTEVPALEPRSSREQESSQRGEVLSVQADVQQKIAQLDTAKLAAPNRKTLDDSRTFLAQSRKALEEGDLPRSLNLARKALLLVDALGKK